MISCDHDNLLIFHTHIFVRHISYFLFVGIISEGLNFWSVAIFTNPYDPFSNLIVRESDFILTLSILDYNQTRM